MLSPVGEWHRHQAGMHHAGTKLQYRCQHGTIQVPEPGASCSRGQRATMTWKAYGYQHPVHLSCYWPCANARMCAISFLFCPVPRYVRQRTIGPFLAHAPGISCCATMALDRLNYHNIITFQFPSSVTSTSLCSTVQYLGAAWSTVTGTCAYQAPTATTGT